MTTPFYVITIVDADDPHGTTVHSFTEPALWEWLHQHEHFETKQSCREVAVPFTDQRLDITRWNPRLDKAQGLASINHPMLTQHLLGVPGNARFAADYAKLVQRAGRSHVYEGTW